MKKTAYLFIILILASCSSARLPGNSETALLIESQEFEFIAQSMTPPGINPGSIAGAGYGLKLMDDSISVLLPFFGRAFGPSTNRNGGPIQLNTTAFTKTSRIHDGRWEFRFEPADQMQVRQLFLSVSNNGYASLQVISTNRETVSFNGVIESLKEK